MAYVHRCISTCPLCRMPFNDSDLDFRFPEDSDGEELSLSSYVFILYSALCLIQVPRTGKATTNASGTTAARLQKCGLSRPSVIAPCITIQVPAKRSTRAPCPAAGSSIVISRTMNGSGTRRRSSASISLAGESISMHISSC